MVRLSWLTVVRLAAVAALAMPACQCPRTVPPPGVEQAAPAAAARVLPTAQRGWDVKEVEIARGRVAPATFAAAAAPATAVETPLPDAPSVNLEADPDNGGVPLRVTFTASVDDDTPGLSFDWDFGDGAHRAGSSKVVHHTYTTAGEYTATVVARSAGGSDSDTTGVEVDRSGFDVDIDADPDSGPAPLQVTLTATLNTPDDDGGDAPDLSTYQFSWDLGDGTREFGPTVLTTYSRPGTYTVRLVVTNRNGQKGRDTTDIEVDAPDEG